MLLGRCKGEGRCTAAHPKSQLTSTARRRTSVQERFDSCVTPAVRLLFMTQVDSNLAPGIVFVLRPEDLRKVRLIHLKLPISLLPILDFP